MEDVMFDLDVAVTGRPIPTPQEVFRLISVKRKELDCLEIALHAILADRDRKAEKQSAKGGDHDA